MKQNNQHYHYIITLDTPYWPRKLVDELLMRRDFQEHLLSVTDTQNDTHVYGATYTVRNESHRAAVV